MEMRKRMPGKSIAEVGDDIRQLAQKAYSYLGMTVFTKKFNKCRPFDAPSIISKYITPS